MPEPCSHLKYFIKTYTSQITTTALTVNRHFKGKHFDDVPFEIIHNFCIDIAKSGDFFSEKEKLEELNATCENYNFHLKSCEPSHWAYTSWNVPKCTMVEFLTHANFITFLECVAAYTIVFNASISDIYVETKYKQCHSGSSIGNCWYHNDYLDVLYYKMGSSPKQQRIEYILDFTEYKSIGVKKIPEEYENVMVKPISSTYKVPKIEIKLNEPPHYFTSNDMFPSGGYIYPFYGVFCACFTY